MRRILPIFAAVVLLWGCRPYKVPIEQGNLLDKQAVAKLRPGMSKEEVSTTLGTPVLDNSLNRDRWIDIYYKRDSKGKEIANQRLILEFKNNRLMSIQ